MIHKIEVWSRLAGSQLVGELVCEIGAQGKTVGAFRYVKHYLDHPERFALDPVSLPLKPDTFSVNHPGVPGVLVDSLPDDWGRRLLIRKHNISLRDQNLPSLLLALGGAGLGALMFSSKGNPSPATPDASTMDLDTLVEAAEMFERGEIQDPMLSLLLGAASSPGGARPKALVRDGATQYIAKFPSIKDDVNIVRIEAATMNLAARAGLVIPPIRLVRCADRDVLLVERFDVVPGGRRHMISMQTLLKAEGYYQCRYEDMLEIIRKYSSDPATDTSLLYRQMVFNAVIDNTDDHLKNFWMVYGRNEGWRLSPAFDLLPDVGRRGEHVLFFDLSPYCPGRRKLEQLGRAWRVTNSRTVIDEVFEALSTWRRGFADAGVTNEDMEKLRLGQIDKNLVS